MLSPTSALLGTVILASVLPSLPISALLSLPFPSLSSMNEISGLYVGADVSISILDLTGSPSLPASSFATTDISCLPSGNGSFGVNVHLPS